MKILSLILSVLMMQTAVVRAADVDELELTQMVKARQAQQTRELEASKQRVARLQKELEQAKGAGAQFWFKRMAQVCGTATVVAAVIAVASMSDRYGHYFGKSADERAGGAFLGAIVGIPSAVCTGVTGLIYSLTNDDVEALDTMVRAAEIELKTLQKEAGKKE